MARSLRLLALVFAAAGGARAAAAELAFWVPDHEQAAWQQVAEAYNATLGAEAARVVVTARRLDDLGERISGAVPRGRGPDLFAYPQDLLGAWVEGGATVTPLDRLVTPEVRARFSRLGLAAMTYRQGLYALPALLDLDLLYVNTARVQSIPRTTADLAAIARALTDRKAGVYGLAWKYDDPWHHAALQNAFGRGLFDGQAQIKLDAAENVRALELLLSWHEAFLPDQPGDADEEAVWRLFNQGRAAMLIDRLGARLKAAPGLQLALAPLPAVSEAGGRPMLSGVLVTGVFVAASSKQQGPAYEFAEFATRPAQLTLLALGTGQVPASARPDPWAPEEGLACVVRDALAVAAPVPNRYEVALARWVVPRAIRIAVSGRASPAAALEEAQRQLTPRHVIGKR